MIVSPPEKEITLPSEDVSFTLTSQQLEKMKKASSVYQLPDISVMGDGQTIKLVARDKKNDTSNNFDIEVGETTETFVFNFKEENLKVLPGTYDVVVSSKLLSRFSSQNCDLVYYIILEPDSTFGPMKITEEIIKEIECLLDMRKRMVMSSGKMGLN